MARQRARSVIDDCSPPPPEPSDVTRCLVYCRVRPTFARDFEDGAFQLLTLQDKQVIVKDERTYVFDGTFQGDSKQDDVFRTVALPCIQHAFKGFCSALMCYGQTGTGKSFTMCCTKPGNEGIIPQAAQFIFASVRRDPSRAYHITGEFIQIYRDQLGDLMTEGGKDRVDIHFDATEGVTLPGCSSHVLTSPEEFMTFYHEGDKRRVVTATAMNPESSRGHTALVIRISSTAVDTSVNGTIRGKITFIDLAGYERFSKTGISNANAVMKDEAKTINASLLSLGHVVTSLSNGEKHIPWRNSKLTRLLQDSIGGRSRTTIILTVGPSSDHLHESTNTLQFGTRAMAVKVQAKMSLTVDYEKLAAKLQSMLDEKNARISDLEIQAAANDTERQELQFRHRRDQEALLLQHAEELENARNQGKTADELLTMSKQLTLEAANLKEQQEEEVTYHEEQHQREMMTLFAEEQKKAARSLEQEKMRRERAIDELERRLAEARGGADSDLERALIELAEKDSVLSDRATDVARLSETVARLSAQLRSNAIVPEVEDDVELSVYLDISQVEDMKRRYTSEIEALHNLAADLRRNVDDSRERIGKKQDEIGALSNRLRQLAADDLVADMLKGPESTEDIEALRSSLQSDIDFWRSRAGSLQEQLEEVQREKATTPRTGRKRSDSVAVSRAAPDAAIRIERLESENAALKATLSGASDLEGVRQVLKSKDAMLDSNLALVGQLEKQLQDSRRQINALKVQLASAGRTESLANDSLCNASFNSSPEQIHRAVNLDQFTTMVRVLRDANLELESAVLTGKTADSNDKLEAQQRELNEKDATILHQASEIEFLMQSLARLERQLEDAGETPICRMDSQSRARADEQSAVQMAQMAAQQQAFEAELASKAAEKQKVAALLQTLNRDRMSEAAVFAARQAELEQKVQDAAKALDAKERAAAAELAAVRAKQSQEEQAAADLREQLQENTRLMMEAQARLAQEQETNAGGFFSKFKKRFAYSIAISSPERSRSGSSKRRFAFWPVAITQCSALRWGWFS